MLIQCFSTVLSMEMRQVGPLAGLLSSVGSTCSTGVTQGLWFRLWLALMSSNRHRLTQLPARSVGAHVRDAAAYVCWAFARAYSPEALGATGEVLGA